MLKDMGRAEYFAATDDEALDAFQRVSKLEGIIPALETSHAFAHLEVTFLPKIEILQHGSHNAQVLPGSVCEALC